jgi:hypothetical protein
MAASVLQIGKFGDRDIKKSVSPEPLSGVISGLENFAF